MHLDRDTYQAFVEALKKNNGLFTVGMYEDIQARHKKGSEKRAAAKKPAVAKPRQLTGTSAATELTAEEIEQMMLEQWRTLDIDQPEPLSMQYFSERTEARLEMSTAALLHHDEGGVELTTRDISPSGLCAITRTPIFLDEGSVVDIEIPAIEGKIGTVRSGYTILNVDHTKAGIQLRLQHSESDPDHRKAIDAFIDANNSRYRVDVSDELLTANALLTERLYTLSSALLPLFFCGDTDGARVGLVGVSDGNRAMLEQFKKGESGFDLSPFMQPHRLQHFLSCNTEQSCPEPLMMIYRDAASGSLISATDFEFATRSDWVNFVISHQKHPGFQLLKLVISPYHKPSCRKMIACLNQVAENNYDSAENILKMVDEISAVGIVSDMTEVAEQWMFSDAIPDAVTIPNKVLELGQGELPNQPEIVTLGRDIQRREPRYLIKTSVVLTIGEQRIESNTVNLSVGGVSIALDEHELEINPRQIVEISFQRYAEQTGKNFLKHVSYQVVSLSGNPRCLHLSRLFDRDSNAAVDQVDKSVTDFFRNVFKRNAEKLQVDYSDTISTAQTRTLEAIATASTSTIPLMIGKNAQGAMRLSQIVMPDDDEGLIRFFEVAPGEFDFSPIAEHRRIARIGNELRSSAQASLPIYMFKQPIIDEPGRFEILSATDAEFKNETERRRFFEHAMLQEQCSVKIVISKAAKLPIHFVDSVTDKLQQHSSHRAHKLREAIGDIEFIGDMVNITRESTEMFIDQINRR